MFKRTDDVVGRQLSDVIILFKSITDVPQVIRTSGVFCFV